MREVVVIGGGLHPYGLFPDKSEADMGTIAIQNALADAGLKWPDIDTAYCGTVRPSLLAGHQICNRMGFTGLGITNLENASAKARARDVGRDSYNASQQDG